MSHYTKVMRERESETPKVSHCLNVRKTLNVMEKKTRWQEAIIISSERKNGADHVTQQQPALGGIDWPEWANVCILPVEHYHCG